MIKKESYGIGEKQFTLSVFNYFTNIKFNWSSIFIYFTM